VRPYWKGYLKLALVSCPIALHAACSTAERIAFRQINKATGNRLRQQLIDEETRTPVAPEDKGRGYEVAKGQYLIVDDAELDAIEIESTHTIEIDRFVPRAQIDQRFFDSPYYVMPSEPVGQEAFAVIREAMRKKGVVALAQADVCRAAAGDQSNGGITPQRRQGDQTGCAAQGSSGAQTGVSIMAQRSATQPLAHHGLSVA
jgi:DNA end-binding protein Ku